MRTIVIAIVTTIVTTIVTITLLLAPGQRVVAEAVRIDGGLFNSPVLREDAAQERMIEPFLLDTRQVSNAEFLEFVKAHPKWQRDRAPQLFRDPGYLSHWAGPAALASGDAGPDRPVTRVSWYAARAYCRAQGGRLPTMDEWEYASQRQREALGIGDSEYAHALFSWYANPGSGILEAVAQGPADGLGVHDLHGLVLEWVENFQLVLGRGEDIDLLSGSCGDTARFMPEFDEAHYATFLRYQSRSNYLPTSTTSTLGFRCAYDIEETP